MSETNHLLCYEFRNGLVTQATCGRPSLGLPFLSVYRSICWSAVHSVQWLAVTVVTVSFDVDCVFFLEEGFHHDKCYIKCHQADRCFSDLSRGGNCAFMSL